tara:strand:+ start:170 stop:283 length:114 start_codon:yes stop_codon:yes gene_type:complete
MKNKFSEIHSKNIGKGTSIQGIPENSLVFGNPSKNIK